LREGAPDGTGIEVALLTRMALFWETSPPPQPQPKPAPLSPLAVAVLLKLQVESGK
jgi:hypothetical protein